MDPGAVYRSPMTLDDDLAAPMVSHPLGCFDCVPVVSGADAIVVVATDPPAARRPIVRLRVEAGSSIVTSTRLAQASRRSTAFDSGQVTSVQRGRAAPTGAASLT